MLVLKKSTFRWTAYVFMQAHYSSVGSVPWFQVLLCTFRKLDPHCSGWRLHGYFVGSRSFTGVLPISRASVPTVWMMGWGTPGSKASTFRYVRDEYSLDCCFRASGQYLFTAFFTIFFQDDFLYGCSKGSEAEVNRILQVGFWFCWILWISFHNKLSLGYLVFDRVVM